VLRLRLCFFTAASALFRCLQASESDRRQLLSFVVCGGGPSGVEVAAELHDMVHHDLAAQFPALMRHVSIRLVEMQDRVLTSYSPSAGAFAASQFEREGELSPACMRQL
jgi:NADH dehydrogenase FAD-containing subunit